MPGLAGELMTRPLLFLALAFGLGAQPKPTDAQRLYAEAARAWDARESGKFKPIESRRDAFILGFMVGVLSREMKPVMAGEPSRVYLLVPSKATTRPPEIDFGGGPARAVASKPGWWKRHLGDSSLHLGATSLDAASSWGRPELHPLLRNSRGEFGARGLSIKLAIFGGVELAKWTMLRRGHRGVAMRSMSLAPAAAFGGVAARNWRSR